jgi:hypothetical protein
MPTMNNTRLRRAGHENLVTPGRLKTIITAIMGAVGVPIAAMIAIPITVFIMAMAAWAAATPQLEGTPARAFPRKVYTASTRYP